MKAIRLAPRIGFRPWARSAHRLWRPGNVSPQSNIRRSLPGALAAQSGDSANSSRALGDRAASARTFADRRKDDEKLGERLREGTRITDVQGSFPFFGDRVAFYPDHLG